jgi:hypothetical protein
VIFVFAFVILIVGVALAGIVDFIDGCMDRARAAKQRRHDCSCDPRFFPAAMDADCPTHGLAVFLRERLEADAARVSA